MSVKQILFEKIMEISDAVLIKYDLIVRNLKFQEKTNVYFFLHKFKGMKKKKNN